MSKLPEFVPNPNIAEIERVARGLTGADRDALLHAAADFAALQARYERATLPDVGGVVVAYCDPSNPLNHEAFAWPGTDRLPRHTTPLYLTPVRVNEAMVERAARVVAGSDEEWDGYSQDVRNGRMEIQRAALTAAMEVPHD